MAARIGGHALRAKPAYETISETMLAYMAGIIDGEGTIAISQGMQNGYFHSQTRLSISNTDLRLLKWLVRVWGGTCTRMACVSLDHRVRYIWVVSSVLAYEVLVRVEPYLMLKRDHALLAMEFQRMIWARPKGRRPPLSAEQIETRMELHERLKSMNARGKSRSSLISGRGPLNETEREYLVGESI